MTAWELYDMAVDTLFLVIGGVHTILALTCQEPGHGSFEHVAVAVIALCLGSFGTAQRMRRKRGS